MQDQKFEDDDERSFSNSLLLVPSTGNTCFINGLPPELLARIFDAGATLIQNEDDVKDLVDYFDNIYRRDPSEECVDSEDTDVSDAEMMRISTNGKGKKARDRNDEAKSDKKYSDSFGSLLSPLPPFQIIVSCVCRLWREVALSTPSLWTTIIVGPQARPPFRPVTFWLDQSKSLPIDIFIDCEPPEDEDDEEYGTEYVPISMLELKMLYELLLPHVHRWRSVEVSVDEPMHMHAFLAAASDSSITAAPQLGRLELYDHESFDEPDHDGTLSLIDSRIVLFGGLAPRLTTIVLWGVHVDWNQPWIASATNLLHLELAYHPEHNRPTWSQFNSILRGAPSLEQLSLRQSGPSEDPPQWFIEPSLESPVDINAPIRLTKLRKLVLAFHWEARAIGLLRKFYLPALKNLVLDFEDGDYTEFVRVLAGPATAMYPSSSQEPLRSLLSGLEHLKIAGLPCKMDCCKTIYSKLENLTQLDLSLSYLPDQWIDILCKPRDGGVWLPRLVTLYISDATPSTLCEVVKQRMEMGVALDELYVEASCILDPEDRRWLAQNVKKFEFFEGSDDEDIDDDEDDEDYDDYEDDDFDDVDEDEDEDEGYVDESTDED